jgi:uncharacterized protein
VLYVDSSALIKHYIREPGTDALNAKLSQELIHHPNVFISVVGYAEVLAIFARRRKESLLSKREYGQLQQRFRDDWMPELAAVELTAPVLLFIPNLVTEHPLKASDAIHLASALWLRDALRLGVNFAPANRSLTFVCSDKQLKNAASSEGLEVVDPEDQS